MWSWRTQPKEDLGTSSYVSVFGQEPRLGSGIEKEMGIEAPYEEEELENIWKTERNQFVEAVRKDMRERSERHSKRMLKDILNDTPRTYKEGDLVWLWDKPLDDQHGRKLDPIWLGPYFIRAAHPNGSYTLEAGDAKLVGKGYTYNYSHLKPVNTTSDEMDEIVQNDI